MIWYNYLSTLQLLTLIEFVLRDAMVFRDFMYLMVLRDLIMFMFLSSLMCTALQSTSRLSASIILHQIPNYTISSAQPIFALEKSISGCCS